VVKQQIADYKQCKKLGKQLKLAQAETRCFWAQEQRAFAHWTEARKMLEEGLTQEQVDMYKLPLDFVGGYSVYHSNSRIVQDFMVQRLCHRMMEYQDIQAMVAAEEALGVPHISIYDEVEKELGLEQGAIKEVGESTWVEGVEYGTRTMAWESERELTQTLTVGGK
jgi:hypothetical protein